MKAVVKIGVKFCGNCNPYIDTVQLLEELKNSYKDIKYVNWDEEYSLLLILNSCPVGCATHPDFSGNKIILNNDSINYEPVLTEDLLNILKKIINEFITIKEV